MVRGWKFLSKEVDALYYLCSENKGADQLCCYRTADLHLCYHICKKQETSHDAVHMVLDVYSTFQVFLNISMGCDETLDTQDLSADLL